MSTENNYSEDIRDARFELRLTKEERGLAKELARIRGLPGVASLMRRLLIEERDRKDGKLPAQDLSTAVQTIANLLQAAQETPAQAKPAKKRRKAS